jgi:glycosyltransferase involved in cell wall biosynthesis
VSEPRQVLPRAGAAEGQERLGDLRIAVLLPCLNEAGTIETVIADFRRALPAATVYVYDNASTDDTARCAAAAGAVVRRETMRGKGNVVRRMFADVDADVYVLADGDGTYNAQDAPAIISLLLDGPTDMVVAARTRTIDAALQERRGHNLGNAALSRLVGSIFGPHLTDILSGYRAMSRRFVKTFPGDSSGFEIETELSVHALDLRMPVAETPSGYRARGEDSGDSKLNTFRDGLRIGRTILNLFRHFRPLAFFGLLSLVLALPGLVLAGIVTAEYLDTGTVLRIPSVVAATGLLILAVVCLTAGVILDSVSKSRRATKRLFYLAQDPPPTPRGRA